VRLPAISLALCVAASSLACAAYDPARDPKIPRPPKVVEWSHALHIDAPPEQVWAVLVDFEHYAEWNPWLVAGHGPAQVGARVDITVILDGKQRELWHRVVSVEENEGFCWRDGGPTTGFATGLRCRTLEADGEGGTNFRVVLTVGGAFRKTVVKRYGEQLQSAMEAETAALGVEAQRRFAAEG